MGRTINSNIINKYLERHAEKESRFSIAKFEEQFGSLAIFSNVLVVPIFDEQSDCLNSIFKNITTSDTLIIPVVNAPEQTYVRDSRVQYLPEKIERRGAERFELIAQHLNDTQLANFYRNLAKSEERHWVLFVNLASGNYPESEIISRFNELSEIENDILSGLPISARLH